MKSLKKLFRSPWRLVRSWIYTHIRYQLVRVGRDFYCGPDTFIMPNWVSIGDYCSIGRNCFLDSQVKIGHFVMLASYVAIVGGDHRFDMPGTPTIFSGRNTNKPVTIHDDVWIGHGALIMHGVEIGEGAIVAAGSLVTKNVPPYTVVAGRPAVELRKRFVDERDQERHSNMLREYRETRKPRDWHYVEVL